MKKIFSLFGLCMFLFFIFGNTVFASTDPDALSIEKVRKEYEARLKRTATNEFKEVKYDYNNHELIIVPTDTELENFVFNYDSDANTLSYERIETDPITYAVDALIIYELINTIGILHDFTEEECIDFFEMVFNERDFPYEIDGFYLNVENTNGGEGMDALMTIEFEISLNSDFKYALAEVIGKDIEKEEPEEPTTKPSTTTKSTTKSTTRSTSKSSDEQVVNSSESSTTQNPEKNPSTSDLTTKNIVFIGMCFVAIAAFGIKKVKKMN